MDISAFIVWNSCLSTVTSQMRDALLKHLSSELSQKLQELPVLSIDLEKQIPPLEEELSHIHYSWFTPFLRSLPEHEIKLFLSSLDLGHIKELRQALLLSNTLPTPSTIGRTYLKKTLLETLAPSDLLPIAYLPPHPLNALLELTSSELSSLVELLSMHDLSIEIRHIIETTKLKEIRSLLSKPQMTFLKTLLHKKEPVSFKKMGLVNWKGDLEALRSMLIQRGVNRIAKSLYGHNPSLLWYAAHRLDIEKGELLLKLCSPLDHPHAAALLTDQVVELVHALKQSNPSSTL